MSTRTRWLVTGAAVLAVAVLGVGIAIALGDGDDVVTTGPPTTTTLPTTTSTTTVSAPLTVATTGGGSSVTVGIICTTPEDAAQSIVNAWKAGDQAAARRCASDSVVTQLFKTNGAGAQWTFQGCDGPDPGVPTCSFSYQGGGATFTMNGTEAAGWKAVQLTYVAD